MTTLAPLPTPAGTLTRDAGLLALAAAAHRAHAAAAPLAVLTLDLDHFKAWSDGVDAATAADAIAKVGALLAAETDASASHLGGDEFMQIMPGRDLEQALETAERLRESIAAALAAYEALPPLTATLGVAASPSDSAWTGDALLSLADARMTFAKKRLAPHHNLAFAGALPSDWYTRLDIDPNKWPTV
ncbi:MAG: diguanylate cyclase [Pelomonas sp.]|nr:diguanylate cyclase [Roseateles sp.]